jgi:eukaryotic-like serine/threonine-protein kinase
MPASEHRPTEQKKIAGIFISYRRSDTPDAVGRIYDRLVSEFGKARVFKDVDSIPLGQDFRGHLNDIVGGCAAVLAIVGPKWTDVRNEAGNRRLEDPDDFVRIELEAALARSVPVVPVLVGHAPMPGTSQLPSTLASLAFRQSIEVRPDPDFHNDATRLVSALKRILDPAALDVPEPDEMGGTREKQVAMGRPGARMAWIVAAAMGLAAAVLAIPAWKYFHQPPLREVRSEINTTDTNRPLDFALSPDGRLIAYVAADGGVSMLWLRSLDSGDARSLPGTANAMAPFWSPDSASIGYFTTTGLRRFDIKGGQSRVILPTSSLNPAGASWSSDGTILFAPTGTGTVMRVSDTGGEVTQVTNLESAQLGHGGPQWLPDGRHFLFQAGGSPNQSGVYLGNLEGSAPVRLLDTSARIGYLQSGWILFDRDGSLVAQRLDADKSRLVGEPVTLAADTADAETLFGRISTSHDGLIAYRGAASRTRQLRWFDRSGRLLGALGDADPTISNPRISPDGRRVSVDRTMNGNTDVWLLDGTRSTRLTFDPQIDARSLWSSDGRELMFYSMRSGKLDLYRKASDGAGAEVRLFDSDPGADRVRVPSGVSRDGRFLLFTSVNDKSGADLHYLALDGKQQPRVWLQTPFQEGWGAFSPDGRWVAYSSEESGSSEVYVRRFRVPGENSDASAVTESRWQISAAGGTFPLWRPDGKELYFLTPNGDLMAAPISASAESITSGTSAKLFATRIFGAGREGAQGRQYDVAPDGRFLINSELDAGAAQPIRLIQNWNPGAR